MQCRTFTAIYYAALQFIALRNRNKIALSECVLFYVNILMKATVRCTLLNAQRLIIELRPVLPDGLDPITLMNV